MRKASAQIQRQQQQQLRCTFGSRRRGSGGCSTSSCSSRNFGSMPLLLPRKNYHRAVVLPTAAALILNSGIVGTITGTKGRGRTRRTRADFLRFLSSPISPMNEGEGEVVMIRKGVVREGAQQHNEKGEIISLSNDEIFLPQSYQAVPRSNKTTARTAAAFNQLKELVQQSNNIVLITGAGCSTKSGIPDYRGEEGSYSKGHKPMTHDNFMFSPEERQRYWARSMKGWGPFYKAEPNQAHRAMAQLENAGKVEHVITQNVDGLHQKAGSKTVTELHGTNHRVRCMSCNQTWDRNRHQRFVTAMNLWWLKEHDARNDDKNLIVPEWNLMKGSEDSTAKIKTGGTESQHLRADGDAELGQGLDYSRIKVPKCRDCGGIVKPDVVFFGDSVPRERVITASKAVDNADLVIAAGTSISVLSAHRLILQANKNGIPIVVINKGPTRAERENIPLLKVEAEVGETLGKLADDLKL
mmetsp:Transcript_27518/g.44335  ORF Transcript_27518/g.44335 Transcript_27518/m.44335 type:complete len:469 (+) Transcript_27518:355-1761(+)